MEAYNATQNRFFWFIKNHTNRFLSNKQTLSNATNNTLIYFIVQKKASSNKDLGGRIQLRNTVIFATRIFPSQEQEKGLDARGKPRISRAFPRFSGDWVTYGPPPPLRECGKPPRAHGGVTRCETPLAEAGATDATHERVKNKMPPLSEIHIHDQRILLLIGRRHGGFKN